MNTPDKMEVTILEDGTLRIEIAGKISAPNHIIAENFLREAAKLAGGTVSVKHTHGAHGHEHGHDHGEHQHQ